MPKRTSSLPGTSPAPTEKTWGLSDYDDLLAGMRDPATLRQVDRRGMTPTIAAALDSGSLVHRLMAMLDEPESEGETALNRIENLLGETLEQQRLNGEKLDAILVILRMVAPRLARSIGVTTPSEPID